MSYEFGFEVIGTNVCLKKFDGFLTRSNSIDSDAAISLAGRVVGDCDWDYVDATCFENMKDGTTKQRRTTRFENPTKSLKIAVTDNFEAVAWHKAFMNAAVDWAQLTNAEKNKKSVMQQFIDAHKLNVKVKTVEKIRNGFSFYVNVYTWKTFEDKTLFMLKY